MLIELGAIIVISSLYSIGNILQSKGLKGKKIKFSNLLNLLKNKYLLLGILSAIIAGIILVISIKNIDISVFQSGMNLVLVITAILDWKFLNYKIGKKEILGMLMIIVGVIFIVA